MSCKSQHCHKKWKPSVFQSGCGRKPLGPWNQFWSIAQCVFHAPEIPWLQHHHSEYGPKLGQFHPSTRNPINIIEYHWYHPPIIRGGHIISAGFPTIFGITIDNAPKKCGCLQHVLATMVPPTSRSLPGAGVGLFVSPWWSIHFGVPKWGVSSGTWFLKLQRGTFLSHMGLS